LGSEVQTATGIKLNEGVRKLICCKRKGLHGFKFLLSR
jgi:hypothetical protein